MTSSITVFQALHALYS